MGISWLFDWLAAVRRARPRPFTATLQPSQALWLLTLFATLYRRNVDASLLVRECVPPLRGADLERIAGHIGLAATLEAVDAGSLAGVVARSQCPIAVEVRGAGEPPEVEATDWAVVLDANGALAMLACRNTGAVQTLPMQALRSRMTGASIRLRPQAVAATDPDAAGTRRPVFGFHWFLPELLKHRVLWKDILLASVVLQMLALGLPLFTQAIIDKVIVHRTQSTLIALSVGMVVFIVFTALLTWVRQYLILHVGRRVDAVLCSHAFEHLFKLPLRYFHHRPTGVVAARMQGVETIREFISSAAVTLILDLPFLLIFVAIMFWYSVALTLVVLAILGLIVGASLLVAPLFQARLNEQFLRGAANQAFLTEYVSGMETVKSLQLEPQLNGRYRDLLATFLDSSFRTRQLGNAYSTFAGTLEQVMTLLVLVLGAWIVMQGPSPQPSPETVRGSGGLTIGMLVAFQMFASRVSQPMLRLVGLWQQFQQARLAVSRLGDVMSAPAETYRLERARAGTGAGAVAIERLSFRYDDNLPLLFEAFSLDVAPGQLIAIMGPSGVGKSTLAKLLQGFYVPTGGSIRVDGVDTCYMAANELRSHFGVVPQETTLFSGTILDNLKIAAPFATFEQVVAACRMAEIHSAIEALPNGYQTELGERGVGLSGGQRQRLAIARALLKGPRILIFDEATASLDPPTADQLARTINGLKQRATILFIAHALPRTLQVDHVVRIGEKVSVVPSEKRPEVTPSPILGEGRGEGIL
jgi:subfamily B ATP-binding cassette protein HlyB/CyaB